MKNDLIIEILTSVDHSSWHFTYFEFKFTAIKNKRKEDKKRKIRKEKKERKK